MTTALDTNLTTARPARKALHVGLWIAQGLLAAAFLMAGSMKLTTPVDALAAKMAWVTHFAPAMVRFIGTMEVLGALGLILPSALRIQPKLTVAAAAGLFALMLGAAGTHISIGEGAFIAPNVVLASLAAFVAWGRSKAAPIVARS